MPSRRAHNGSVCGRYAAAKDAAELAGWFRAEQMPVVELPARYNLTPTSEAYIVVNEDGERVIETARWGLIPSWSKDATRASRMINARVETVAEKPAYRAAFRRRRCLVPADGYYEWQAGVGARTPKQPFYIHRADGRPLAMAGLFEDWQGPTGPVRTFTVLTRDAVGSLGRIHDRMPVVVDEDGWEGWLDPSSTQEAVASVLEEALLAGDDRLEAYPVSTRVNKATNEGPELRTPIGPPVPVG